MTDSEKLLDPALGYVGLGMYEEAWKELEALPPTLQAHDEVLELRIAIFKGLEKWEAARVLAESLVRRSPENPGWWLSWSYALRRERSVEAALCVLREAAELHPDVAPIAYNLACYACVLGQMAETLELLKRAVAMDPALRTMAMNDPDLEPLWESDWQFNPIPSHD